MEDDVEMHKNTVIRTSDGSGFTAHQNAVLRGTGAFWDAERCFYSLSGHDGLGVGLGIFVQLNGLAAEECQLPYDAGWYAPRDPEPTFVSDLSWNGDEIISTVFANSRLQVAWFIEPGKPNQAFMASRFIDRDAGWDIHVDDPASITTPRPSWVIIATPNEVIDMSSWLFDEAAAQRLNAEQRQLYVGEPDQVALRVGLKTGRIKQH